MTNIAGIKVPSTSPIFLGIVALHVLLGLACVLTGVVAILSAKRPGRHPNFGTIYFWCLSGAGHRIVGGALAAGLHIICTGSLVVCGSISRTNRKAPTLDWMDSLAHYRNGHLVCLFTDRILCG